MSSVVSRELRLPAIVMCALVAVVVAGCGGALRRASARAAAIPIARCSAQPVARAPLPGELGVYRSGPLTLAVGEDLAQHPQEWPGRRTSGSETIAVLRGGRPAVLSVDPVSRRRFSLQFTSTGRGHPSPVLSDGRSVVRFPACSGRIHRFGGAVLFKGKGCARLHVRQPGSAALPMLIPIGNTLAGCPGVTRPIPLGEPVSPFLGVACHIGNSISCDRVGIGVRLHAPATLVVVCVAGRLVTLSPPSDRRDDLWLGYLDNAGLRRGPLKVHIPAGTQFWFGTPGTFALVHVIVFLPDGRAATHRGTVMLNPGFG